MTIMQVIGMLFIGAGIGFVLAGGYIFVLRWMAARKFRAFLERLKEIGDEEEAAAKTKKEISAKSTREISELIFRDKDGVAQTVRIVIDHDIDDMMTDEDKKNVKALLTGGKSTDPDIRTGSMDDLLAGCKVEEAAMAKVQEFVFSPKAVRDMRLAGIEPEEVVTKMLKASGRME